MFNENLSHELGLENLSSRCSCSVGFGHDAVFVPFRYRNSQSGSCRLIALETLVSKLSPLQIVSPYTSPCLSSLILDEFSRVR